MPETTLPARNLTASLRGDGVSRRDATEGRNRVEECNDLPLCGKSGAFFVDKAGALSYDLATHSSDVTSLKFVPSPVC